MKKDIILAGVGGQGILSIAAAIGLAAVESGLYLKQAEVHGMSQRGGAVQSHLRISESEIASDLIPVGACDMILSVEPMESLRYLPYLHAEGWIITSSNEVRNIPDYPDREELLAEIRNWRNHLIVDALGLARDLGSGKVSNMVMLGAAYRYLDLSSECFRKAVSRLFGRKGPDVVNLNLLALEAGQNAVKNP